MKNRFLPATDAGGARRFPVERLREGDLEEDSDLVTVEEPLEIRVVAEEGGSRRVWSVAVTMRTPGQDFELAAGFLVSEGVVRSASDIWRIGRCETASHGADANIVDVYLAPSIGFDLDQLSRHVVTSSACGICGRTSIDSVRALRPPTLGDELELPIPLLAGLTPRLEAAQSVFARTGGLHAAALFDRRGRLLLLREDVGRHNAFDKMVGALLGEEQLPAATRLAMVSGRVSFELVQKALLAGIPALVAVGAPSSLAIELASDYGMTLIGFYRDSSYNVYSGSKRLRSG